jgi:hypothetical protein
MSKKKINFSVIIFLVSICFNSFAQTENLNDMAQYKGCFVGIDQFGVKTKASLSLILKQESFYELSIDKKQVSFYEFAFYQPKKDAYLIVNIFNQGRFDFRDDGFVYKFSNEIQRSVHGEVIKKHRYKTIFKLKKSQDKYIFKNLQTDNSKLLPDRYNGKKLLKLRSFTMKKVDC